MKRVFLLILLFIFLQIRALADNTVFSENGKFGLKDQNGNITVKAEYKKLIRLGDNSWIVQDGSKYGIIDDNGRTLVSAKYNRAERVLGKYAKFAKGDKYGIFDDSGFEILPVEYSSIDLIPGRMFLTCKNFKYGLTDFNGQMVLDNVFDDIYTVNREKIVFVYQGQVFDYKIDLSDDNDSFLNIKSDMETVDEYSSDFTDNPISATGYYGVTVSDYILKLISSISPAYEQSIDELMLSQGADTVNIFMKFSWIPKFPFVYVKQYYKNLINPANGPLGKVKSSLKKHSH